MRTLLGLTVALLALSTSACSDVLAGGDGELTQAEAVALAGQLGMESMGFASGQGGAHAVAAQGIDIEYAFSRPCALGGSVDSSGNLQVTHDDETASSTVDIVATDVHQGCVFLAGETRVSVTGAPEVTTEVHVASRAGEPFGTQTVSVLGAVLWEADDDRSGRCEVDILVQVEPDAESRTVRGAFCEHSFDVTVTNGG